MISFYFSSFHNLESHHYRKCNVLNIGTHYFIHWIINNVEDLSQMEATNLNFGANFLNILDNVSTWVWLERKIRYCNCYHFRFLFHFRPRDFRFLVLRQVREVHDHLRPLDLKGKGFEVWFSAECLVQFWINDRLALLEWFL